MTRVFVVSTSLVLLLIGVGKLGLGFGSMNDLFLLDPIFGIRFRFMMLTAGVVELGFGLACLAWCQTRQQKGLLLIAWLGTSLALYRWGLWLMDWRRPCDCMGYLTKPLHLSPQAADNTMKIILVYMLAGSYAGLFWLWKEGRNKSNDAKKIVDLEAREVV